ncbi:CynX/NimT family MFS transporter [Nesterenkonia flava]|uniref:MFS transporter n=1 Tax=Nesterenkonia flava TaxID=469799 RepID=A0ABU1FQG6_9MICC|nr:MFS transporter [Nesterenkonia flava]MDR5710612.1 MFS transporter [Nesterenkonia flava]
MEHARAAAPSRLLLLATVLVVAANLRPAITVVGPLIERIGSDTGMSAVSLGVLGAAPVFTFAVVSPFVHLLGRRWGMERAIFIALLVLTVGTLLRALPAVPYTLFAGTVLLAAAIGVTNVLVPIIVKRDFPDRVPMMTGAYTASLTAVASVASGVAVPLADSIGWQYALASTALLSLIAAALWSTRLARRDRTSAHVSAAPASAPAQKERSVWTSGLAWQVTLFFGFQSSIFYFFLTWMASIHTYQGYSERTAGYSVAAFQAIGIVATLVIGRIMQRMADHRMVAVGLGTGMGVGVLGMILFPAVMPLWAVICGLSSTATLMLSMTMISLRANSGEQAAQLSGMAQGLGYIIGGVLPVLGGNLFEVTGSWLPPLYAALVVIAIYTTVGYFAGRNVQIPPAGPRR